MDQGICQSCGLLFLQSAENCPRCGGDVSPRSPASAGLSDDAAVSPAPPPGDPAELTRPVAWEIVHECRHQFEAITLQSELEQHGILSWVRSLEVGGYPGIVFRETIWGWLLVDKDDLEAAGEVISQFFVDIQSGEDTESHSGPSVRELNFKEDREE